MKYRRLAFHFFDDTFVVQELYLRGILNKLKRSTLETLMNLLVV